METQIQPKSRTPLYIILGLLLVAVLAAAAFLAGKLMNQQVNEPNGMQIIGGGPNGEGPAGGQMMSMSVRIEPAPELPQTEAEVTGVFTRREDNSLFVGTFSGGSSTGVVVEGSSSGPAINLDQPSYDGPVVEVVVTNETKIYVDTTQIDPSQSSQEVQQTVGPGSLDELGSDSMVIVWGRRTGDRVVADVLMYSKPMIVTFPGK